MVWLLRRCLNCGRYTLSKEKCPYCNGEVRVPHPPKSSIYDKYREYRRRMKEIAKTDSSLD
jgi:H/ACA ribonucleoprotein complex subunit 3